MHPKRHRAKDLVALEFRSVTIIIPYQGTWYHTREKEGTLLQRKTSILSMRVSDGKGPPDAFRRRRRYNVASIFPSNSP